MSQMLHTYVMGEKHSINQPESWSLLLIREVVMERPGGDSQAGF